MIEADLPLVLQWRNLPAVRQNMYTTHEIQADEHAAWFARQSVDPRVRLLVFERDDQPLGFVGITEYEGPGGTATWAFYAGEGAPKGTGRLMEYHALRFAFEDLQVRKLNCEVLAFNAPVIAMHQKYGFSIEGVFRAGYLRGDEAIDIYRLAMLGSEWSRAVKAFFEQPAADSLAGKVFSRTVVFDDALVSTFGEASGDSNPIHFNHEAAQAMGFDGRIAHGLLGVSQFSGILGTDIDPRGLVYLSQTADFLRPIPVGSTVNVDVKIVSHVGRRLLAETLVSVDDKVAVRGTASLLAPKPEVAA
ncbi:MAG TPA: UDP-4-amino-4,6-dideoxy-N-acetyl-beta-L-altrosamine N-acetyltransferase [Marmoricola sp.]|nr:UDP-4-amino-4,6-dideoxy-N-acetyl-beta-L-altrosamine N-acetyltransferase [Marmoricola sp.]